MTTGATLAEVAALVGDPSRANMLAALLDGRALTATELARAAGITPATASGHLARLAQGGLLAGAAQGRHRYFKLASPEVARMLEGIMVVASDQPARPRATPRVPPALREARTCYDHLAGRLAVAITDALVARGAIVLMQDAGEITADGQALLGRFGLPPADTRKSNRLYCRPCLDWSERRPHLAGGLGAALLDRGLDLGWIRRAEGRAITVTPAGRRGFHEAFGVAI